MAFERKNRIKNWKRAKRRRRNCKRGATRLEYVLMKLVPTIFLLAFISVGQILVACNAGENQHDATQSSKANQSVNARVFNENANSVKDTVEELELTIKLPSHPEEVLWREQKSDAQSNAANAQTGKKLTAILKFSAEDAAKIVAQAETYQPPTFAQIETEIWFPAELKAQSELSGDETLKGNAYAANDFLQPPYDAGKLTRLEDSNYFILELSGK